MSLHGALQMLSAKLTSENVPLKLVAAYNP